MKSLLRTMLRGSHSPGSACHQRMARRRFPLLLANPEIFRGRTSAPSHAFRCLLILALGLLFVGTASATGSWIHPDLERARVALSNSRGPATYTAIRKVWRTWDRADPLHVEQTLLGASADPKLDSFAREYAAILVAYARQRRGDLAGAARTIEELGFIDDWMIAGPFDNEGKTGLEQVFEPELALTEAIVPGRAFAGKERPVRWRQIPNAFPFGWLDLGSLLRPDANVCAYLATFVRTRRDDDSRRVVSLWVGIGGAFKVFWNGEAVLQDEAYRAHDVDRQAVSVWLEPGFNRLTLKVCGDETTPQISVRVRANRGYGDAEVETSASSQTSAEAAKLPPVKSPPFPATVRGPLQRFDDLINKTPSPDNLEEFANYLVETHSDDPVRHQARDLAARSAELAPTGDRLLLAARLAEDQNSSLQWVERTIEALGPAANRNVDLLLAQASLLRKSPRWREALQKYERARALDPDRIEAVEGLVALYNQVNLQRTALGELESALSRHPHSVGLLSIYATQLRKLGRSVEATEAESRYASLRFDDRGYLASQAQLAASRQDGPLAQHWLARLLESSPDSFWAFGVASRIQRSLGENERAVAILRRALTLAPDDVPTLRALADLQGELGKRDDQLRLLERLLNVRPQDRETREYVEYLRPATAKQDELYSWEATQFLRDRSAAADGYNQRTLRDLTVTTVYENGLSSRFRQVVFQPLTDTAAALARQYAFQYQADREVVQLRGAKVYRMDGGVDEAIESGEGAANDPDISMYTSARTFYVQFPRLEPGDVVELKYRVDGIARQNVFADYFGEVVPFQSNEPVANAEYVLITPKKRSMNVDVQLDGLERTEKVDGNQRIYRFFAAAVPALMPEPEMPPWPEILGFVHASTYKSWRALGKWYWGLINDQFELDDETRKLARDLAKGKASELEKVKAVYGWVVKNTRYVALEFGIYGYKPRRSVQTIARGWGDCKDKATVIVSLLAELGIESTPVLLRSQMRGGFPSRIPSLEPFDHVIVYVPSLDLYLDGTAEYTGSMELPEMDQGALGLLINRGDAQLVQLPLTSKEPNVIARTIEAQLRRDGSAALVVSYDVRGSSAPSWRRRYGAESTRRERIVDMLGDDWPGFGLQPGAGSIKVGNLDDIESAVTMKIRGYATSFAHQEDKSLSVEVTPSVRLTSTFASLKTRKQDVRLLGVPIVEDTYVVRLPAGTRVSDLPRSSRGESEFGNYALDVTKVGDVVTAKSTLNLTKASVTPASYDRFRQFCAAADQAFNQRLVVE